MSIKVFARVRPSKRPSGYFTFQEEHNQLKFDVPLNKDAGLVNNTKSEHIFKFDGLLDMGVSQEQVFNMVAKDAVMSAIDGFNSTLFAYGQTGSGKTFTITGGAERYQDRGIIPRSLSYMFQEFKQRPDTQFTAYISYLELYNEQGYDLLDPSHETKSLEELPRVTIMEDDDGNTHLKGLSMHPASTEEEALNLLFLGDTNRAISETPMNDASSRSHCVFTISIEARSAGSSSIRRSKFHLVDLAGSERVHKTNSSGQTLREAKHINTSLHFLEMVIINLTGKKKKRGFVPYRNCRITQVLRDSLGGNCKTAMIATINPEAAQTEESISTCRFAQRVAQVKNSAIVNEETDPYLLIKRLKAEVASLKAEIAFLNGEQTDGGELSDEERAQLLQLCKEWVHTPGGKEQEPQLMLGDFSLSRIHGAFFALKHLVLEGGGGGGGKSSADKDFQPLPAAREASDVDGAEVKRMRAQLHQRDQEIAILVKMVQKEKLKNKGGGGGGGGGGAPLSSAASGAGSHPDPRASYGNGLPPKASSPIQVPGQSNAALGMTRSSDFGSTAGSMGDMRASIGTAGSGSVGVGSGGGRVGAGVGGMLATFSVPTEVLLDRKAALQAFKRNYPKQRVVEDNLQVMKQKIAEVKKLAGGVNNARKRIQYLKATIEQVRVEAAVHGIVDESKSNQPSAQEAKLLEDIAAEKKGYKQGYQDLQRLRKEIEHIDKLVTKCRKQLNADFESWYSGSLDRAGLTHTSVAAISGVMSSAKARGGEASAGGSSPGSRKPATAASAGAGAGAGTHPQAPQHRQPASHAAGGAMPAAGPPRHSDGRRGAGTPTSSQASGAPPSRSGGSGWRGSSAETRMSSDPGLGSSVNLYDRARAMQMQQMQAQFPQYGQPGPPQRRVGSAGSARPMPVASGVPVASAPMPAGHPHQAGSQPQYSRAPAYAQQHSAAPQYGQPAAGPAYGAGTYAQHATPAQAAPVYPASPGRGIRSSGATHATSHQLPGSNSHSTDEDIRAFYQAKAQLDQLRRSGSYK